MGKSKSWRGGPGWSAKKTPGPKKEYYSKGSESTAEGASTMSGGSYGRMGKKGGNPGRKGKAKMVGGYGMS